MKMVSIRHVLTVLEYRLFPIIFDSDWYWQIIMHSRNKPTDRGALKDRPASYNVLWYARFFQLSESSKL
jgi:hypothetical protein